MTIIVTDHHEIPYEEGQNGIQYLIPPADAVIDPKREDCSYPFKGLCGAAVAYKLIEALFEVLGQDPEDVDYLMENVAIATVGDVMDLVDENRIFVKQGLEMLKCTRNPGLRALMECTQVNKDKLSAYHIGFVIGPCLNASGRLDTARRALDLLCAKGQKEADVLAGDLKSLNDSRKEMTVRAVEEAITTLEESGQKRDKVLVIFLPNCHESLAGIVAGRVRELYGKPTFVLTRTTEGVKGSGRSIDAYHMYEELNKCKHLLVKFGGHKLAAGVSLQEEYVEEFRRALNGNTTLDEDDFIPRVSIDLQLPFVYLDEDFITQLNRLEPFGRGNTKPIFAEKDLTVENVRILGKNQNVAKMQMKDINGNVMDAVYFGDVQKFMSFLEAKQYTDLAITYYPTLNEFHGNTKIEIVIQNYK